MPILDVSEYQYQVIIAALEYVGDEGECRTALTDGDKASTWPFAEVADNLTAEYGDPFEDG